MEVITGIRNIRSIDPGVVAAVAAVLQAAILINTRRGRHVDVVTLVESCSHFDCCLFLLVFPAIYKAVKNHITPVLHVPLDQLGWIHYAGPYDQMNCIFELTQSNSQ
jgi:hypothetical protein